METKGEESRASTQKQAGGLGGVCDILHQVLCKQWPWACMQPWTPGGTETDILMREREHPALRYSRPVSGVDMQMFNNWQGECIDQSEWTRATGP